MIDRHPVATVFPPLTLAVERSRPRFFVAAAGQTGAHRVPVRGGGRP